MGAPLVLVAILIVVMTLVYFGSVVNPTGHLHGLPVSVADRDTAPPSVASTSTSGASWPAV